MDPIKILYDGLIFSQQPAGGISRYFSNVIDHLPAPFQPGLATIRKNTVNYPARPDLRVHYYERFGFWPGRLSYEVEPYYFDWIARGYPIIHPTYYGLLARKPFKKLRSKVVLTVYDMIHEVFAATLDPTGEEAASKRGAIRRADAILCISENTRLDLLRFYPDVPPENVFVTYLAAGLSFGMTAGPEPVPEKPYLLYVGGRSKYKNFPGLLRAFARIAPDHPDLELCAVGVDPFWGEELILISELGLEGRVRYLGNLEDAHLAKTYRHCVAFVYPSAYEGFGIPPLEAMACGAPTVVSDRSSLPEVVGDAALLFNPDDPGQLVERLDQVVRAGSGLRDELIAKGFAQARRFDWQKTADQTAAVYAGLLKR